MKSEFIAALAHKAEEIENAYFEKIEAEEAIDVTI